MVWENVAKDKRNESLDLRIYGMAALRLLKPNFDALEKRLKNVITGASAPSKTKQSSAKKRYGAVRRAADS
jgi:hypothetical protein